MGKVQQILNEFSGNGAALLPSYLQIGDQCYIHYEDFKIDNARVIGVYFTASKVTYDLEFMFMANKEVSVIGNIDSALLKKSILKK